MLFLMHRITSVGLGTATYILYSAILPFKLNKSDLLIFFIVRDLCDRYTAN